jgi:hypothetical protein
MAKVGINVNKMSTAALIKLMRRRFRSRHSLISVLTSDPATRAAWDRGWLEFALLNRFIHKANALNMLLLGSTKG